ncbi:hypothetical protein F5Y13DRAFT_192459 [Hypoxylon sp. FL1857]|nr:hypothetical protein F5Y13DRAFT_192459 [Hypoxylon sp. FL1857]
MSRRLRCMPTRLQEVECQYPFNKDEFDNLRSQLREFYVRLLGHLQLINLDATREIRSIVIAESTKIPVAVEAVGRRLQSSISNTEHVVVGTVRDSISQLKSTLQDGLQETEKNIATSVEIGLHNLSDRLGKGQDNQTLDIKRYMDHRFRLLEASLRAQAGNTAEDGTSLLGPDTNESRRKRNVGGKAPLGMTAASILNTRCNCPRMRLGGSGIQHQKGCIYSFTNRKKRNFAIRFRAFRREIIARWELEYFQLAWTRDWQIHPNLTVRAIVSWKAPAFDALSLLSGMILPTTQDLEKALQNCLVKLRLIFESGQGWPTDRAENGYNFNLLHRFCLFILPELVPLDSTCTEEELVPIMHFIHALIDMGVPVNDASFVGHDTVLLIMLLGITDLYECFITEFSIQVLSRSESDVIRSLNTDPSLLWERTPGAQTPFHLAANWPRGLEILIEFAGDATEAIMHTSDNGGKTPLEFAIELEEPHSVKILLDAGMKFGFKQFWPIQVLRDSAQADEIKSIVIGTLATRRRNLWQLALINLPPKIIENFGVEEDALLDTNAFDVLQALRREHILLPTIYDDCRPGSVYHWCGINRSIAQKLFDAGFRGPDVKFCGYTPLMAMETEGLYNGSPSCRLVAKLELLHWFKTHGADLHTPVPVFGYSLSSENYRSHPTYPVIHLIATRLGEVLYKDIEYPLLDRELFKLKAPKENVSRNQRSQLLKLLGDGIADPCICYCTTNGCTPASKYACGFLGIAKRYYLYYDTMGVISKRVIALDIIRVSTFEILGMKHTCCRYKERRYCDDIQRYIKGGILHLTDPEERDEIREEDRYLAEQLDFLMVEFEGKFRELNMPLSQFMEDYFFPRIREVWAEKDELSTEDIEDIRGIGVVLDKS